MFGLRNLSPVLRRCQEDNVGEFETILNISFARRCAGIVTEIKPETGENCEGPSNSPTPVTQDPSTSIRIVCVVILVNIHIRIPPY